jgi:orotate phosphoribosyltransferase
MTDGVTQALAGLAEQIAAAATLDGEFVLRSGQVSHRYFDKYRFEGMPALLKRCRRCQCSRSRVCNMAR